MLPCSVIVRPLLIVAAVLVLAGFQSPARSADCARIDPGIDQLHRDWSAAMARADVDSLLQLFEPDLVVVPADGAPVSGRKDLERMLWSTFGRTRVNATFTCERRWRQGDLVVERGWESETLKPLSGAARRTTGRPVLLTLRRSHDGRWRFAWRGFESSR